MESKEVVVDKLLCMACLSIGRTLHNIVDQRMQHCFLGTLNQIPLCNVPQVCPRVCWECKALLRKTTLFLEQVKDSYRILQTYTSENLHKFLVSDITRNPRFDTHHTDPVSIPPAGLEAPIEFEEVKSLDQKPDVHLVCVKEENHDWNGDLDDIFSNDDRPPSVTEDNLADIEREIDTILPNKGKRKRKKSPPLCAVNDADVEKELNEFVEKEKKRSKRKLKDKVKKTKKIGKRIKTENKLPKVKKEVDQKILTIELSYEEMLLEREKESKRDSYMKSEYKCESCLIGFKYAKSYETHCKSKHSLDLGNYSCPICKTIIASVESFTSHYKRHMRRYECSICHKRTMDVKVMQQHYYSTHEIQLKNYTCNICGKVSNSIDTHRYHRDTHKARIECSECDKTFSHRAGLLNHRLTVHELHNDFPCEVCGKTFRWKTSLKRHLEKHDESKYKHGIPAAVCEPCNIGFQSVSSYQRHLRNSLKHVSQNQLRFICDPCGKRFADKTKLRDHIEEKHLHRTYQCHICSKPSKNRVGLDQHIRNVHKGRPNNKVCHYCGKAFPTKVQLESHIRSHTGERPYICELCPTTFSQQSNLYKHNRQVHLNIKSKRYPLTKKRKEASEPAAEPYRPLLYLTPDASFIS
ncbi:hypothetical protein O0L34_g15823 [Tuta absoluta]|nr:hypothetical protein O0L34_g15823 [Tuta absoluta]